MEPFELWRTIGVLKRNGEPGGAEEKGECGPMLQRDWRLPREFACSPSPENRLPRDMDWSLFLGLGELPLCMKSFSRFTLRCSSGHTIRNASPMFLLMAPENSCTHECTMAAIRFTYSITTSRRASVVSVNPRMTTKPKRPTIVLPGVMGLISPPTRKLFPMMAAPASPNPICSREAILEMDCTSSLVSACSEEVILSVFILSSGLFAKSAIICMMFSIGWMQYLEEARLTA
mmetsp:Transcript_5968/g.15639  ORF Transcript_5968/g.15639 Transcript_5968/m.15639 type:complete len:232 (-) Transcript_5968:1476-2171(-)